MKLIHGSQKLYICLKTPLVHNVCDFTGSKISILLVKYVIICIHTYFYTYNYNET